MKTLEEPEILKHLYTVGIASDLPERGVCGDIYYSGITGRNYTYDGKKWLSLNETPTSKEKIDYGTVMSTLDLPHNPPRDATAYCNVEMKRFDYVFDIKRWKYWNKTLYEDFISKGKTSREHPVIEGLMLTAEDYTVVIYELENRGYDVEKIQTDEDYREQIKLVFSISRGWL